MRTMEMMDKYYIIIRKIEKYKQVNLYLKMNVMNIGYIAKLTKMLEK